MRATIGATDPLGILNIGFLANVGAGAGDALAQIRSMGADFEAKFVTALAPELRPPPDALPNGR